MIRRLLVVDDNEDDLRLTLRALSAEGTDRDLVLAHDGKQALDLFRTEKLDAALIDLKVPFLHADEILQTLQSEGEVIPPTVVLTSSALPEDSARCRAAGALDVLVKPICMYEYEETVKTAIATLTSAHKSCAVSR